MPLVMRREHDTFFPDGRCDACGRLLSRSADVSFALWPLDAVSVGPILLACSPSCADVLTAQAQPRELGAVSFDAYLVALGEQLHIDPEAIQRRERLAYAIDRARDEAQE